MKIFSIAIFAAIILSSCTSLKVTSNFDKELDISKSKTYSFYGWTEVNDMIDIDKQVIEKAFSNELSQRGLTYQELGGDINILFFVVVDKESTSNRHNSYFGPYGYAMPTWGWGTGYGYGYGSGNSSAGVPHSENQFYKGTVVCSAFDNTSKKLAWQGVVVKAIKKNNPKRADIPKIVEKLMNNFPIPKVVQQ